MISRRRRYLLDLADACCKADMRIESLPGLPYSPGKLHAAGSELRKLAMADVAEDSTMDVGAPTTNQAPGGDGDA